MISIVRTSIFDRKSTELGFQLETRNLPTIGTTPGREALSLETGAMGRIKADPVAYTWWNVALID